MGFLLFVVKDWFAVARANLLQSSEQQLNLRAITKGGVGNYVVKTNRMNLGLAGWVQPGTMRIIAISQRMAGNSAEAFVALEYNIFNLGDLDLLTKVIAYPSLTESGRFRTDFSFNIKYEFKRDFFINLGLSAIMITSRLKVHPPLIMFYRPPLDGNYKVENGLISDA